MEDVNLQKSGLWTFSHHDVPAGLAYLGHPVGQPEEPRRAILPGLSVQIAFLGTEDKGDIF